MEPLEVALVFVVLPLAVIGVLAALTLPGNRRKEKRYRPGRPFEFTPVWFLSSPGQLAGRLAISASDTTGSAGEAPANPHGPTGGASDRW
ncbi:aa3-type cytochrome oxidase subunit CtaJ [Catenuloplanes japonicus]|uniref:aa3-type cytochrome oxidase subunit CtaJ n=1 Tax=Catenuloplanes japonicus TaxID=33876 RepID=UPI0005268EC0|nr:hypothetical protein [Catenuloplanes japonicus]